MAGSTNRRAVRWLRGQLPGLVAAGVISPENAQAIERHYGSEEASSSFAFILLAIVGSVLVSAGIILLIAHNWDEFSRPLRSAIAFLPLILAQALSVFVLLRRNESKPWRETAAIFDVAAVGTAISLISQTYQIQGTFASFMQIWLLLSIPVVYLLRTSFGAGMYLIGAVVWLFSIENFFGVRASPNLFWLFLALLVPYYVIRFRENRNSAETAILSILLAVAAAIGLGMTADFTRTNMGNLAFAGLATTIYLCGIIFFPREDGLHPVAFLGGLGVGIVAVVLSFEPLWNFHHRLTTQWVEWQSLGLAGQVAVGIQILFPVAAVILGLWAIIAHGPVRFSLVAFLLPFVTAVAWLEVYFCLGDCSFLAALLFDLYAFAFGVEVLVRGIRVRSVARANFGLLIIAGLAICRFFDTDLSFVERGVGFIVVGAGFLIANVIFFRKRATTS